MTKAHYTSPTHKFVTHAQSFPLSTTAEHWQLQDCITCPEQRHEVYSLNNHYVQCYNTKIRQTSVVSHKLSYNAVGLNVGYGYIVTSGEQGELSLYNTRTGRHKNTLAGKLINNCVTFNPNPLYLTPEQRRSANPHLLVCSNDKTVRIFSLPDLKPMHGITFDEAINCASVSPDGRKLVTVSDSEVVQLFDIRNSTYEPALTFRSNHGAAYSCNWNMLSNTFAVATNYGYVDVWDIRSTKKLHQVASTQHPGKEGSCRVVKFAPSYVADMLVFSEQSNFVNVVDTRTFGEVQRIPVTDRGHKITGFTFSPEGSELYVGLANRLLQFDVDLRSRCCFGSASYT
ncbi:hypothetical protein IWQ62_002282 [Dispira parvispora]|uniref:DUF2415 domain-containing protein n=1 Tax=Dispira parvispora TaxID=1520584 RepID=A0A9W8AQP8_9FUNG|nr:hypothetical protein IWQ62_002282 [Dispira parvispora]